MTDVGRSPVRVVQGLTKVLDHAISLFDTKDERLLIDRLQKGMDVDDLWAVVEYLTGEGATTANIDFGFALLIALYERKKNEARRVVRRYLDSSFDDIDCALRVINSTEDTFFRSALESLLDREDLPTWLRTTVEDAYGSGEAES